MTTWPARSARDHLALAIATAGGAGLSPVAPGTMGTIVAIPLAWALSAAGLPLYLIATLVVTVAGIWAADRADRLWGTHDSGRIVIDEVAGYLLTMAWVDRGASSTGACRAAPGSCSTTWRPGSWPAWCSPAWP
jgi:phosphatidylglycerophosphatase A